MNCPSARETFAELLDPRTPATAHAEARSHLAGCPECQRELAGLAQTLAALDAMPTPAPSPRLRQNFYAMLAEEKRAAVAAPAPEVRAPTAHPTPRWRWLLATAGAAALALGAFQAGMRQGATAPDPAMAQKFALLEGRLDEMRKLMALSIIQQQQSVPTSARFQEVLAAAQEANPTEKTINDLIMAVTLDPSAHVRLRALEALMPRVGDGAVRAGILAALPREQNPLVQLEMIEAIAAVPDPASRPALDALARNETADLTVREAAQRVLIQL